MHHIRRLRSTECFHATYMYVNILGYVRIALDNCGHACRRTQMATLALGDERCSMQALQRSCAPRNPRQTCSPPCFRRLLIKPEEKINVETRLSALKPNVVSPPGSVMPLAQLSATDELKSKAWRHLCLEGKHRKCPS